MSIPLQIAAYTILLPAILSGLVFVVARQLDVRRSIDGYWGAAVALALGYIAGHIGTLGTPAYPPVEATPWLVYIAVAGLVIGGIENNWRDKTWLTWGVRTVLLALMGWLLLRPLIAYTWSTVQSFGWVVGLVAYALALWATVERLGKDAPPKRVGLLFMLWGTAQSIAIVVSQSAVLAQLQGVLVSTIGAAFVLAWRFPRVRVSLVSGTSLVAALFVAHAADGFFYAELPALSVTTLGLVPILALFVWRIGDGTKIAVAGFAAAIAASAAAVWIAVSNSPPSY